MTNDGLVGQRTPSTAPPANEISPLARFPCEQDKQGQCAVEREDRALGHDVGENISSHRGERGEREQSGDEECRFSREDDLGRAGHRKQSNDEQERVDQAHGKRVSLATRLIAVSAIGFDAASHGRGEARVDFHRGEDERWIDRAEEHSRRRAGDRAVVARGENSIAEHAVFVEIVGDGHVEDLIEIPQLPRRTLQNHESQYGERKAAEEQFFQHGS